MKRERTSLLIGGMLSWFLFLGMSCTSQPGSTEGKAGQNTGTIRLKGGEMTAIVTAAEPSVREQLAARELADYLFKITGKQLPVKQVSGTSIPEGAIAVGRLAQQSGFITEEKLKAVAPDGFIVKINGNMGAVCGWRDLGTLYGAYDLLKEAGVRFYAQECEVVPEKKKLEIPELDKSVKPAYEMRAIFKYDVYFPGRKPSPKLGYTPYDDMGYPGDLGAPEERNWVHSASFLMPYRIYGKDHPEYFALQKDGSRYKPGDGPPGHLCLSNQEMLKECSQRLLYLIEQQKERTFFVVTQGDGRSRSWCQCEACKALDAIPGDHMTDRLLTYVNYCARVVAEKFPEKKILTLAYTEATARPPEKLMPDSNVMMMYCPYPPQTMCQSHGLDCPENRVGLEELKGWLDKCPDNMYIFDYPRGYNTWYEPFGSFFAMVSKMNLYYSSGVKGLIQCVVPTTFTDLFVFIQGKLFWEPDADVEALIDEFMAAYYGKAAPAMREYLNFMHHEIDNRPVHQMCERANPDLVTADYADRGLEMFKKAQQAVARDSVRLKRVEVDKFCVLWSDIDQRNTVKGNLEVSIDEHILRFGETVRIGRDMKVIQLARGKAFQDWLRTVSPLWLQSVPWYNDPAVEVVIAHTENLFKL